MWHVRGRKIYDQFFVRMTEGKNNFIDLEVDGRIY